MKPAEGCFSPYGSVRHYYQLLSVSRNAATDPQLENYALHMYIYIAFFYSFSLLAANPAFICLAAVRPVFGKPSSPSLSPALCSSTTTPQATRSLNKAAVSPPTGEKYFN